MAYANMVVPLFNYIEDIVRYKSDRNKVEGGVAIGIGTHDFWISKKVLKKYNITTISNSDIEKHQLTSLGDEFAKSSKNLAKLFFKYYGYSTYVDLDIYDRADIIFDLCKPLPDDIYQKFDLVFDPTSNYVVNIHQSYANTSRLLKIGGVKIVISVLGDSTNRFDLNPSPNYLIDFHTNNGFLLEKVFLMDRNGRIIPYKRYQTKVTPVDTLLPFSLYLLYVIKTFMISLFMRKLVRSASYIDYLGAYNENNKEVKKSVALSHITPADNVAKSRIRSLVKQVLSEKQLNHIRIVLNRTTRMKEIFLSNLISQYISPYWTAVIVLRKMNESSYDSFHITAHYRHLDQTK